MGVEKPPPLPPCLPEDAADYGFIIGQLKWLWFQENRSLQDIVKYDSATRGPLGSLFLLRTLGFQHPLSSLGGLITILMLAVDPFSQQVIRYHDCNPVLHSHQATIARTNLYIGDSSNLDGEDIGISIGLRSAISAGTFSPGTLVTPSCLTGNCSFPEPYSTVAFCGGCTDVTDSIKIEWSSAEELYQEEDTVVLYLPSGAQINSTIDERPTEQCLATMQVFENQATFIFIKSPEDLNRVKGIYSQSRNGTCQSADDLWGCLGYGAAICTTNPCVRTYNATVAAGEFNETWLAESNDGIADYDHVFGRNVEIFPDDPPQVLATVDTECISPLERSSLIAAGYHLDPNVRWLQYNLTFEPWLVSNSSFPSSLLHHGCLYAINEYIADELWTMHLAYVFNGTLSRDTDEGAWNNYLGPQNLETIYNYGNVTFASLDKMFRNISESLTTHIRQNGNQNHSDPATGDVTRADACLQVRWVWLTFPTALLLCTVLFFVVVVIKTRPAGERAQIWKSSPLPLIFHGLEERHYKDSNDSFDEKKDMERLAQKLTVKLAHTKNGVKLATVDDRGSVKNGERQETLDSVSSMPHMKF